MNPNIQTIDSRTFTVNGKEIFENIDGKLQTKHHFTNEEKTAFLEYYNAFLEKKTASDKKPSGLGVRQQLALLDLKIANVHRQRDILDSSKDLMSDESIKLRNYYENKLSEYNTKRNALIKDLPVRDACVINAEQSAKRTPSAS